MKRLILTAFLLAFVIAIASPALADNTQDKLGPCNVSVEGQLKTITYDNGCGSAEYRCVITRCSPGMRCIGVPPRWRLQSCKSNGAGLCCISPETPYQNYTCGYASVQCSPCKICGNGACSTNLADDTICHQDSTVGYCASGECTLDNAPPNITNSQKNAYISTMPYLNSSGFSADVFFNVDFSDDLRLKEFTQRICDEESSIYFANRSEFLPAPVISGNCAEETFPLTGKASLRNWNLSKEMWDFILERIANQGKMSVSVQLSDFVGNNVTSNNLFYIINDFTKPVVNASHSITELSESRQAKITATADDSLGEVGIKIYIDGEEAKSCDSSPCEVKRNYAKDARGSHSYYAFAYDPSGNNRTSETKTFTFEAAKTACADFFGQICADGTLCDANVFKASDTDKCCPSTCSEIINNVNNATNGSAVLPGCGDQNGKAFNPATDVCRGQEVAAYGLSGALRCCVGDIENIPDVNRMEVYWQNEAGERIASASVGEMVKCSASGIVGSGSFSITEPDGKQSEPQTLSLPNSIPITIAKIGNYVCEAGVNGQIKTSELNARELPATPKKALLPVFGLFNFISALGLILAYYLYVCRRQGK